MSKGQASIGLRRQHDKLSGQSGNLKTVQKFSRLFGNLPDYLETFQAETFKTVHKLSRLSGNFQD